MSSPLALFLLLVAASSVARAERLPIRAYTTADGLAHNTVNRIVRDSRGFLWFCTAEGLSRFDGYGFTTYGTEQGLPHHNVTNILETREGDYWVATQGGLVRFNPKGEPANRVVYALAVPPGASPMFTVVVPDDEDWRASSVTAVLEGRDGTLWCGTLKGVFRLERNDGPLALRPVEIGMPRAHPEQRFVRDLLEDRHGSLWVGAASGLYRRWPDGKAARYTVRNGLPGESVHDLLEDRRGELWAGTRDGGFFRVAADATDAPPTVHRKFDGWVYQLFETADGRFWVGTNSGLVEFFLDDEQGSRFRTYTANNGLLFHEITALDEDASGNLWLGTQAGAMKIAREGFITYDERDGLLGINAIFGDRKGGVCFRGYVLGDERASVFEGAKLDILRPMDRYHLRYGRFDGQRFTWFRPTAPTSGNFGWVGEGVTLQARNGEWWLGTGEGVYRFPPADDFRQLKTTRPLAVYQTQEGLIGFQQVFRLFEDSRGDIWASSIAAPNGLARWERARQTFRRDLADAPGLPSPNDDLARSFGEDSDGNVWIGFSTGLARYRQGRFTFFTAKDGLPAGEIRNIYSDRRGRLWLASARGGLVRIDAPTAERPAFRSYTTAEGLSSNITEVITEDLNGRIYISTGRGVDRLDPDTNRIKHFTTADGLASGDIKAAFRDARGTLWFGMHKGLSRIAPGPEEPPQPPPILITGLQVAGERRAVSALGETEIILSDLAAHRNQLQISFVGISFAPGEVLRYQYRLEGTGLDWSAPTEQRTIDFATLAPGRYRFLVRAVNSDGVVSPHPAAVAFAVLRPVWQRSWFLSLLAAAVGLAGYALHRHRVSRLLELERVRTRIATDLHDDIGAGLSRIAVLSEVARHEAGDGSSPVTERLSVIARASRELVDSMSDIVWVINPQRDQLRDLTQRMRRFASDVFTSRNVEFTFRATGDGHLTAGADVRRHMFLIFKETINNIVRHSACTRADIELRVEGGWIVLTVVDNGPGFDPARASEGSGLANMRERARLLSGRLQVDSGGRGTTITLMVPLGATVREHNRRLRGSRRE